MRNVLPLETRSTIASASPSRGATSTEPVTRTSSTSTPALAEKLRGESRVHGRDAQPVEIVEPARARLGRDGGLERARAEPERDELVHLRPALANEIGARDPAVDDAVLHVLGDVRGPHEHDVDRRVPARERERPLARLLGAEPCVREERDGRLAEAALRGDRDRQAVRPDARLRRSSTRRYPSAPRFSHCATRVTVVVEAPVLVATSWYGSP